MTQYQLRYSKQAKHLQLKFSYRGLELIVPHKRKISECEIQKFIDDKKVWIEKHQAKFARDIATHPLLPTKIELTSVNQIWTIKYLKTTSNKLLVHANPMQELVLFGPIDNSEGCLLALRHWLRHVAYVLLEPELKRLSTLTGLIYKNLTIRNNITRWGSCSAQKNISLCCKLLFIEAELMQHVILHELCHTKYMHHGRAFQQLLLKWDPHTLRHAKALNDRANSIPSWVFSP
ncbi:MAG: DUF45 domain-containing protein [Gammaproteobacteria bacterium]|nr:DUF45 domain-containing protein [Gammaproteobacteria bacterium]